MKTKPWSRSSSTAIASISVSSSYESWMPPADRLDELEELLRVHLGFVAEEDVREDLLVTFVKLVEVHAGSDRGKGNEWTPSIRLARAGPPERA